MAKPNVTNINESENTKVFVPRIKKNLTPPVLKLDEDITRYIKIDGPMHLGRDVKAKEGEKQKEPAQIIDCTNMESGEVCQIIASAIIRSTLDENYPGQSYVGKAFAITKRGRQPGKQYNKFEILEIEV